MKRAFSLLMAAALAFSLAAGMAAAGQKIVLNMGDVLAEEHPHSKSYLYFAERVKELTNDEVEVRVFVNSALGGQRDLLEGLSLGTVHIAKSMTTLLSAYEPKIQVFDLPFMFAGREHLYKVLDGEIGKYFLKELLPQHGFYGLAYIDAGVRSIYNRTRPVTKLEDAAGLKLRVPESPIFQDSMAAFKILATPMPVGDIYTALQTGVIDGAENSPIFYQLMSHYEAARYYSRTEHMMPPDVVVMDYDFWQTLSPEHQKAILQASDDMVKWERKAWMDLEKSSEEALAKAGVQFNDVDQEGFREAAKSVWAKYAPIIGQDIIDRIQAEK